MAIRAKILAFCAFPCAASYSPALYFESTYVENTIAITPNMSPIQHGEQSPSTVPTIDNTKLLSGLTGLAKSSKLLA